MSVGLNSRITGLTVKGFEKIPELPNEQILQFSKSAKTVFKTGLSVDEEIEFTLTPEVSFGLYQGTTATPEELSAGYNMIRVQYPMFYNFIFYDQKVKQINAMPHGEQDIFMTNIIKNADDKFKMNIERGLIALIPQALFCLNTAPQYNTGSALNPITVGYGNVRQIPEDMMTLMGTGKVVDNVRRTAFEAGKMTLIVPFLFNGMLTATKDAQFTVTGEASKEKGYVGTFGGFKILTSPYLDEPDALGNYFIFAFIDGEANGIIMQKALTSEHLRWQLAFGDVFRGIGIYGVGMIRPDKCAFAYVNFSYTTLTTI